MYITTTPTFEGHRITNYHGVVFGEVVAGVNFLRDFGAGLRNIFGGRSGGYENELISARNNALEELKKRAEQMGANGIVGVDFDYETITAGNGSMLVVIASGTAVTVE
ncbi:MAG: YbjQ family protein [Bacteroidales bacterium]|nr:YbjQ family protein [Bacteroidales bacterium]